MLEMLVRNQVEDYAKWREVFDAGADAARDSGLEVRMIWRDHNDPSQVFFLLSVSSIEKAEAFVSSAESAETGRRAGVVGGELYYVDRMDS